MDSGSQLENRCNLLHRRVALIQRLENNTNQSKGERQTVDVFISKRVKVLRICRRTEASQAES